MSKLKATWMKTKARRPASKRRKPWLISKTPRRSSSRLAAKPRSSLPVEQLARMGDRLKSLAERQEKIVSETASYEALRQKAEGKLTVAQARGRERSRPGSGRPQGRDRRFDREPRRAPVFALTLRRARKTCSGPRRAAELRPASRPKTQPGPLRIASSSFSNR